MLQDILSANVCVFVYANINIYIVTVWIYDVCVSPPSPNMIGSRLHYCAVAIWVLALLTAIFVPSLVVLSVSGLPLPHTQPHQGGWGSHYHWVGGIIQIWNERHVCCRSVSNFCQGTNALAIWSKHLQQKNAVHHDHFVKASRSTHFCRFCLFKAFHFSV